MRKRLNQRLAFIVLIPHNTPARKGQQNDFIISEMTRHFRAGNLAKKGVSKGTATKIYIKN